MGFWDAALWLLIFAPLILMWSLSMMDILQRDDLSGTRKALWSIGIFVIPVLGTLLYLFFRPASTVAPHAATESSRPPAPVAPAGPVPPADGRAQT